MSETEKEELWENILNYLKRNQEDEAINAAKTLSELGDWRGSNALGNIYESKAKKISAEIESKFTEYYVLASECYEKAISQGGGYAPHSGLATYYYYGLNGRYDFEKAYYHLNYCLENSAIKETHSEKLNLDIAKNYIMLAELYFTGYGIKKNIDLAVELYELAAKVGYPASLLGLSRIEKSKKNYISSLIYYIRAFIKAYKFMLQDNNHPLLAGMGGKYRTFRRDLIKTTS